MKISARNVLTSKVDKVIKGAVNSEVDLTLQGGQKIVATITNTSAEALGLSSGKSAYAVIKASEVMIGKNVEGGKISARNVLSGVIDKVQDGAVNSEIIVGLPGGAKIVASITKESVHSLGLKQGENVNAIVKASNVMVGVD